MKACVDFASILLLLLAVLVVSRCTFTLRYAAHTLTFDRSQGPTMDRSKRQHLPTQCGPRKAHPRKGTADTSLVSPQFANISSAQPTVRNDNRGRCPFLAFYKCLMIVTESSGLCVFARNCLHGRYDGEH